MCAQSLNFSDCLVSCDGFYGDVAQEKQDGGNEKDATKLQQLLSEYNGYKSKLAKNLVYRSRSPKFSKLIPPSPPLPFPPKLFAAYEQPYEPLQLVQIYFDTATFDEISRDVKNTMETQISVIGGTMGLFTGLQLINEIVLGVGWMLKFLCPGFSILSGVEIIYFVAKFLIGIFTDNNKKKSRTKC